MIANPHTFWFGDQPVPNSLVFIARKHVYAMVNPRGIMPGHVMVVPIRQNGTAPSQFSELTELETLEMFVCAKQITKAFEEKLKFKSFQILIQDGEATKFKHKSASGIQMMTQS